MLIDLNPLIEDFCFHHASQIRFVTRGQYITPIGLADITRLVNEVLVDTVCNRGRLDYPHGFSDVILTNLMNRLHLLRNVYDSGLTMIETLPDLVDTHISMQLEFWVTEHINNVGPIKKLTKAEQNIWIIS